MASKNKMLFGNPSLLSPDEYAAKFAIQGDPFGHLNRSPAGDDAMSDFSQDEDSPDLNKEVENSEVIGADEAARKTIPQEINQESDDILSTIPQEKPSQLDKYQQFMDQYKQLQDQRRKGDLVNGLIAAGGKIGQSIAGKYSGNFNPDQAGNQMLAKMNERPVQDFEQGQIVKNRGLELQASMAAHDPASPQSGLVRKYIEEKFGWQLDPDVSAADAQQLLKTIGRPATTKFQKVNGTITDPETGKEKRISAVFDPGTGLYKDPNTGAALPGFLAEGLNPFQVVKGEHGEQELFNKSRGRAPTPIKGEANFNQVQSPQEVYALLKPDTRKELNDKIVPNFNKLTEKTQQRLMHEAPIMAKLDEAQLNPAAYAQLQAEMARFDVGDQRLAQQEFNMFATRHGFKGWADWVQKNSTGTISADFAQDFAHTIHNTVHGMQDDLNKQAEKQAGLLISRLPPGQKADPKLIAPLIYSGYKPVMSTSTSANGEIERKTKDGRIAIFSKDKKFLRYKEENPPPQMSAPESSDNEEEE